MHTLNKAKLEALINDKNFEIATRSQLWRGFLDCLEVADEEAGCKHEKTGGNDNQRDCSEWCLDCGKKMEKVPELFKGTMEALDKLTV